MWETDDPAASEANQIRPARPSTAPVLDIMASPQNGADPHPEAAWRALPELNAVRRGAVHVVRDFFVPHDSQMIAKTAVVFAGLLHPDVSAREWEVH